MENDKAKFRITYFLAFVGICFLGFVIFSQAAVTPNSEETGSKQKTTEFFVLQENNVLTNGNSTSTEFEIFIGEDEPDLKNAKIEINGIASSMASNPRIEVYLQNKSGTQQSDISTYNISSSPNSTKFILTFNATTFLSVTSPLVEGSNFYRIFITPFDLSVSLLSATVKINYKFTPPTTGIGYYPFGTLYSATFDTGITQGAAYNSILWKGNIQSGKVKFQLATSDSSSGPWNYYGPGCTTASPDMYDIAADSPASIGCASIHNNKRYSRYKVTICSASNCTSAGSTTPTIDDIIVNWSP